MLDDVIGSHANNFAHYYQLTMNNDISSDIHMITVGKRCKKFFYVKKYKYSRGFFIFLIFFSGITNMKALSPSLIDSCLYLLSQGQSYTSIARQLHISKGSITKIKKTHGLTPPSKASGRPKLISPLSLRTIVRKLTSGELENASQAQKTLAQDLGIKASNDTVRRALKSAGLAARVKVKRPLLKKRHRQACLDFAKKYQYWTVEDWKRVVYSDETKVNRWGSDGRKWCWKRGVQPLLDHHVSTTIKHSSGNVMVWGCMTAQGPGFLTRIDGGLNAELYCNILQDEFMQTLDYYGLDKSDIIFQQDNDPKHTANRTKQWFFENHINVLDWPAQSPDLNPIEHLWFNLKQKLNSYPTQPASIHELWERIQCEWEKITPQECLNLIESMPRRVQNVLQVKGGYTKY